MVATNTRQEAREALKNKWVKAAVMVCLQALIGGILTAIKGAIDNDFIESIISIIEVVIQVPLSFGLIYSFIKLKRNEEVNYFDFIKIGVDNFKKSWALCLRTLLKMILPIICVIVALILFSVMFAVGGVAGLVSGAGQQSLGIIVLGIIIYVAALSYAVIIGLKYALVTYISYDNTDMLAKDVVEKSAELMKGHRGDLFVLILSFLGWAILCYIPLTLAYANTLVTPLAVIFAIGAAVAIVCLSAYIHMAKVCFYEDVLKLNSENKTEVQ